MGRASDYLFRSLFSDYIFLLVPECVDELFDSWSFFRLHILMGAWGREPWGREQWERVELGGMVMGAIFFYYLFQKIYITEVFSHWHESVGMRSDYLFRSLFSDFIFLLVPECVDGLFDS